MRSGVAVQISLAAFGADRPRSLFEACCVLEPPRANAAWFVFFFIISSTRHNAASPGLATPSAFLDVNAFTT